MHYKFLIYFLSFFLIPAHAEVFDVKKKLIISQCFFVYAPIYEAAKKINNEKLLHYGLQRLMYIKGIFSVLATDENFKQLYQLNIEKNKANGILIENNLIKSHKNNNVALFNKTLKEGENCDRELGL